MYTGIWLVAWNLFRGIIIDDSYKKKHRTLLEIIINCDTNDSNW